MFFRGEYNLTAILLSSGVTTWERTDWPALIDLQAYPLNYFPFNQQHVFFFFRHWQAKGIQRATITHNWVLNTMVRSWNATLAARPKASPRTVTKMKVMIQMSCKRKATCIPDIAMDSDSRTMCYVHCYEQVWISREHSRSWKYIGEGTCSRGNFYWLRFWTTETQADIKNPKRVYPLLIPSLAWSRKWLSLSVTAQIPEPADVA